ncbi:hypothetical protein [Microlunatus speluncae]|uniref:hypothetical protein n=1 Tax=Microlunatus speluncae TaxID=2594267 RepID=UPI00126616AD|nr:hypothetical protein [Microlunatus speluncae]
MIIDPVLNRIGEAAALNHHQDQRETARNLLTQIWEDIGGEAGDPLHVCVLAHSMADAQDNPNQELTWDLRALAAAGRIKQDRAEEAGVTLPVAGLYPSLHLNLADCYRKVGDLDRARVHLRLAHQTIDLLGDDDYGRLIRDGLDGLTEQMGQN